MQRVERDLHFCPPKIRQEAAGVDKEHMPGGQVVMDSNLVLSLTSMSP